MNRIVQLSLVALLGSKATLSVVGKTKGEPGTNYGTVQMILEGGSWRVGKQSWEVKDK